MPKQLVEYDLGDGQSIVVEVDLPAGGIQRAGREGEIVKATRTFDEALAQIKPAAQRIITTLRSLADLPDQIAVQFGIKLGAKAGIVIASADTEANFTVTLTWSDSDRAAPPA